MLINTPASQAFETAFDDQSPPVAAEALDKIFDGDGAEAGEVATGEPASESQTPVDESQTDLSITDDSQIDLSASPVESTPATEQPAEDMADRLWWDKCETLAKIKACARMIDEAQSEVDSYQEAIKEAKEVLKGQQALLVRYSSQLADILDGKPVPKKPAEKDTTASTSPASAAASGHPTNSPGVSVAEAIAANNWRIANTSEVIAGLPKMGPTKLERILEIAPTMGQLIDLQIAASRACIPFKDNLPSGWGVELVDALETCIVDYMGQFSDDEPVASEPVASVSDAELASDNPASELGDMKPVSYRGQDDPS